VELIFGQAFGPGPTATRRRVGGATEIAVPVERIRRMTEST